MNNQHVLQFLARALGLALLALVAGSSLPPPAFAENNEIPYVTDEFGGQIIELDEPGAAELPEPVGTVDRPGVVHDLDDLEVTTGKPSAAKPHIPPPPSEPMDWNHIREQMNGRQDNLQPFTEADAKRLDREYQAKRQRQAEVEAHRQRVQEMRAKPSANDLDLMMHQLTDPNLPKADRDRITAVLFVHQDVYREAVGRGDFGADTAHVQQFLQDKKALQRDVIERMGRKYQQQHGKPLQETIIPFDYNNIHSDDDIVTGSGKMAAEMEKLYADSLDELIRERAGRPMTAADRKRIDVNGLTWNMSQQGGMENFSHPEKYINPQSGYANQQKLIESGAEVITFDKNGRMVTLHGDEAAEAIRKLQVDKPMEIPGIDSEVGSGSISDFVRMAEMHQIRFADGKEVDVPEVLQFIRNQKYTQRVDGAFEKIAADSNPAIRKQYERYMRTTDALRKQTTVRGAAEVLQAEYGGRIVDPQSGLVDYEALTQAMRQHQSRQLGEVLPKMHSAVTQNEAYKIAEYLQTAKGAARAELRKQLALTYAPMSESHRQTILDDIEKLEIDADSKAFLKTAVGEDPRQIVRYAQLLELETHALTGKLQLHGDNVAVVDWLMSENAKIKRLGDAVWNRPGGSQFKEFLRSRTAAALNLDLMLGLESTTPKERLQEAGGKLMQATLLLYAAARAYETGTDETDGIKKIAFALFNTIPLVSTVLRTSELEYHAAFKELVLELPPVALADMAVQMLNYAAQAEISAFTEGKIDQIAQSVLDEMSDEDFEESPDLPGYYRVKNRHFMLEYLDEVSPGLGKIAKLPSLVSRQIDALMSRNEQVAINNAAIYTVNYYEAVDIGPIEFRYKEAFSLQELKAKVYEHGMRGVEGASPAERVAAKLVLDNLRIRAEIYEKVMNDFLDRIEDMYNARRGGPKKGKNAIVDDAMRKLKELYEQAPAIITDSAAGQEELDQAYRKRLEHLKDYQADNKETNDIQREMQELLDGFREAIKRIALAVQFWQEKRDLELRATGYGGDKSMLSLDDGELLAGDSFRVGASAKVNPRRRQDRWSLYYYIYREGRWIVLGSRNLNPGKYREGDALMVIEAPDEDTFISVEGETREQYFTSDPRGYYRIHPVMAFGEWSKDPLAEVGLLALQSPIEYYQLFNEHKMAFIGTTLEIQMVKPRVGIRMPMYAYQDDPPLEATAGISLPAYAREEALTAEVELILPDNGGGQPTVMPTTIPKLSTDPAHPSVIRLSFPEDALDGSHTLIVTARLNRLLEPFDTTYGMANFQYLRENRPREDEGDKENREGQETDLAALQDRMEALIAQAQAILGRARTSNNQMRSDHEELQAREATLVEQLKQAQSALQRITAELQTGAQPDLGQYLERVRQSAQHVIENKGRIERDTLGVCSAYEALKASNDPAAIDRIYQKSKQDAAAVDAAYDAVLKEEQDSRYQQRMAAANRSGGQQAEALRPGGSFDQQLTALEQAFGEYRIVQESLAQEAQALQEMDREIGDILHQRDQVVEQADAASGGGDNARQANAIRQRGETLDGLQKQIRDQTIEGQRVGMAVSTSSAGLEAEFQQLSQAAANAKASVRSSEDEERIIQEINASIDTEEVYLEAIRDTRENLAICLAGIDRQYAQSASPAARLANADCSRYPGTEAQWDEADQSVRCNCVEGKWSNTLKQCISAKDAALAGADCSKYPNTEPRWYADEQQVRCSCVKDYVWNRSGTGCHLHPKLAVARSTCGQYGKHVLAIWVEAKEKVMCSCATGYQWSASGDSCVEASVPQELTRRRAPVEEVPEAPGGSGEEEDMAGFLNDLMKKHEQAGADSGDTSGGSKCTPGRTAYEQMINQSLGCPKTGGASAGRDSTGRSTESAGGGVIPGYGTSGATSEGSSGSSTSGTSSEQGQGQGEWPVDTDSGHKGPCYGGIMGQGEC